MTGRKKQRQLIYPSKMWHDSYVSERRWQTKIAFKNVLPATILRSRSPSQNMKIKIYRTIILALFLYGCETCSFTLTVGQAEGG